ncbi:MAG: 2Fe-2S iron-sulfur cluster binding domain-containing protein [Alphaproteobacteria bacterium]|nr:2Fe-2S iron-sulfur cluster binding domain-containing protein [Alphaproteobacteria bacterium]
MSESPDNFGHWKGTRTFVVDSMAEESRTVTSFYLRPEDGGAVPAYKPGQFLSFQLDVPGHDKPVVRSYTLSDSPSGLENGKLYRLSIKREPAPKDQPDLPPGAASNYFHDHVTVGSTLSVIAPAGDFFLHEDRDGPVVLMSGGVGLTPMISMLNHIVDQGAERPVWFLHGVQNGSEHAFRDHVRQLAETMENVRAHMVYAEPGPGDVLGRDYDAEGFITTQMLESLLPGPDCDFYLCGPPPFMKALYNALLGWGVQESRIFYEFFGPATVLKDAPAPTPVAADSVGGVEVVFQKSGVTVAWDGLQESLLVLAEAHGVEADSACRSGVCQTCACRLVEGEVEYTNEDAFLPDDESEILICSSVPKGKVILDL